jgi:N-acetylmuramic acid 6-phosphate etherase
MQDGVELTPTFGWPPGRLVFLLAGGIDSVAGAVENAEDNQEAALAGVAAQSVDDKDLVICIAASGATPFTVACLKEAKRRGALTVGISSNFQSQISKSADISIATDTGPETISGSTRLKAGTAHKIVLNLLSTLIMVRLGHVYRGMMVDMQISNGKLRTRAVRMVCLLGEVSEEEAADALVRSGGAVKSALLIARGLSPSDANKLLHEYGGNLRLAMAAASS